MIDKEVYDEIKKIVDSPAGMRIQSPSYGAPIWDTIISMSKVAEGDVIAKGKVINHFYGGPSIREHRDQYIWRMHDMYSSRVVEEVELFGCDNAEGAIEDIVCRRRGFGEQPEEVCVPELVIIGPQEFMVILEPEQNIARQQGRCDDRVLHFRFVRKEYSNKYYSAWLVPRDLFQGEHYKRYSCQMKRKSFYSAVAVP